MNRLNRRFSVAPMMAWTDRHCRYFLRLISRHTLLYTEMVTSGAVIHGDRKRLLAFNAKEHPVALQLGGSDPAELALAARIGEDAGYDEINLNIGCPSDRVQSGRFGACLMAEPRLVGDCVNAMQAKVRVPVTVKCRIGIDHQDSEEALDHFIDTVADAGCRTFIVHARKAWLAGLSPKENREVPPLDPERVYRLAARRPDMEIIINGGIASLDEAERHLTQLDGVMLGRAAYHTPWLLADADRRFFGSTQNPGSREEVIAKLMPYVEREMAAGAPLHRITRHILGLFHGEPGARHWRRILSQQAVKDGAGTPVITTALGAVSFRRNPSGLIDVPA